MVLAGIIAAIAVLTNNPVLIVGAMIVGVLVSITTIPAAANVGVALAIGNPSEAAKSLSILVVNLAGLLTGGVLTLLGTRVWARRIEAGQAILRPRPKPGR